MMIGEAIIELIGNLFGEFLMKTVIGGSLNFIGGFVRWIYGTIWRTIFNKPKFKFSEYINGSKNSDDWHDKNHGWVNIVVGLIAIVVLIIILIKVI